MKLSNYSLNYSALLKDRKLDAFQFLGLCREMGLEGASLHLNNLESTELDYLKKVRRAYLDLGLSMTVFTVSTDFGQPEEKHAAEFQKARTAIKTALFLGAPLLRVFAGSPPNDADRAAAFDRSAAAVRRVCEEAAKEGLPIGLQNHNHGALCRTGDDVLRYMKKVDHPNLVFLLDTGQFAGSKGASAVVPAELRDADFMESIRKTAPLAKYVRVKFYNPRKDGSEPFIDYDKVFEILRGVHYSGYLDIVYEPGKGANDAGEDVRTAVPRVVAFLRRKMNAQPAGGKPDDVRYGNLDNDKFFTDAEVKTETAVAFTEGPALAPDGSIYFTNGPLDQILRFEPKGRKLSVYRDKSNGANGLKFDSQGRLVACEKDRVTRTDLKTGKTTTLADNYRDKPFGAPNDLEIDGKGRIYFTSRLTNRDEMKGNVNSVYRIDPDGKVVRILAAPQIDMPNGIATSPDDKILYLIDADGQEDHARRIRAYDLKPDGTVANERTLYDFYPGRSGDGMRIDAEGNLYVMAGLHKRRGTSETLDTRPGIHVISPQGKLVAFLPTPEDTITNCMFGGDDLKTLYVTCGKLLLGVRTKIPGKPAYRVKEG